MNNTLAKLLQQQVFAKNDIPDITDTSVNANKELVGSFNPNIKDITKLVPEVFNIILGLAGLVFLVLLLFGGFSYLLGSGNEEKTGKAKKLIVDAVVGLVITASAYGIGTMIIQYFMTGEFKII